MTGSPTHTFTSTEEKECLLALLTAYASGRHRGQVAADANFDRLLAVGEAGMTEDFLLFEVATRIVPQAPLYVSPYLHPSERERLKAYVRQFVLDGPVTPGADAGAR
jgi:hypothetical protein